MSPSPNMSKKCSVRSREICVAWQFIARTVTCTLDLGNVTCALDPAFKNYVLGSPHQKKYACAAGCASRCLENAKGCINKHTAVRIKSLWYVPFRLYHSSTLRSFVTAYPEMLQFNDFESRHFPLISQLRFSRYVQLQRTPRFMTLTK